jgi:hypothetical protein
MLTPFQEKHMQKMLLHLGPGDGAEVDIRSLFVRYSMDIAMDFLIGTDLDSLNHPDGEFAQTWGAVQATQALILRSVSSSSKILRYFLWTLPLT